MSTGNDAPVEPVEVEVFIEGDVTAFAKAAEAVRAGIETVLARRASQ